MDVTLCILILEKQYPPKGSPVGTLPEILKTEKI